MSHLCRVVPGICGTYIRTLTANRAFINELVTSDAFIRKLAAQMITLQDGGVIKSSNYNGDIKKRNGTKGFALDSDGNADFVDMHATGGTFTDMTANNMTADGGTFKNISAEGGLFKNITATDAVIEGKIIAKDGLYYSHDIRFYGSDKDFCNTYKNLYPSGMTRPAVGYIFSTSVFVINSITFKGDSIDLYGVSIGVVRGEHFSCREETRTYNSNMYTSGKEYLYIVKI